MKPNFLIPINDTRVAEFHHKFKDIEFRILLFEKIKDDCHDCKILFRTPNGVLFRHDIKVSYIFLNNENDEIVKEHICSIVYNTFDKTHGWN